jgi:hypothetical protein
MNKQTMPKKVYFIHEGGFGASAADVFVKGIKKIETEKEAYKRYDIDYYMPDCKYVSAFLKEHPEYVYVGSTDNMHERGWGMNLDRYTLVQPPKL